VKMPFGKHRGRDLKDIDENYLTWLRTNVGLRADLRRAVEGELDRRSLGEDEDDDYEEDEYLRALQDQAEALQDLVKTLEQQLLSARLERDSFRQRAERAENRPVFGGFGPKDAPICRMIVEAGYRRLVLRNHPDVGGDARAMVALNRVIELLRAAFPDRKTVRKP